MDSKMRFSVSHLATSEFRDDGLRPFFQYRDLGIRDATNGKVVIRPATKGPGSIAARIGLIRRLLNEGRLYFSAKTPEAIAWARFLRPGRTKGELIAPSSVKFKHKFDADTYIFASELPNEIERKAKPTTFNGLSHIG